MTFRLHAVLYQLAGEEQRGYRVQRAELRDHSPARPDPGLQDGFSCIGIILSWELSLSSRFH